MDITIFIVDPALPDVPRNGERFTKLIETILRNEIREIVLISRRESRSEKSFLDRIPEKRFENPGFFGRFAADRLQKKHLRCESYLISDLIAHFDWKSGRDLFLYFEENSSPVSHDGVDFIDKLIQVRKERSGSAVGIRKISFGEVRDAILLKGTLFSEGIYRIQSAFRGESALKTPSNLALTHILLLENALVSAMMIDPAPGGESRFIDRLDSWAHVNPVYGVLPFRPIRIR